MPILTLSCCGALPASDKHDLGQLLTKLSAQHLGKTLEVTVVRFFDNTVFHNGREVSSEGQFSLEIRVTQGTNTKSQISSFQRSAHDEVAKYLHAEEIGRAHV